ncbi:MAG: DMT family transporter [Chloroflexi bacterium]|nr:MAG: DMT family transporter [Chloroflexota bacterium]
MSITLLSILSGITGMFGWGLYDFLGGVFAKQIGPYKSFFWSQLAGLASMYLLAIFISPSMDIPSVVIFLFPVAALLYSAGYLFFFKGFEVGNMSIVAATMNLWAVFTMLFAFTFMGQRLTVTQTVGVLMILTGVTLASLNWSEIQQRKFQLSTGVREAIAGAFFFGIYWNVSETIVEQVGWLVSTALIKLGIVVFMLLFFAISKRGMGLAGTAGKTISAIFVMGVIEAGSVAVVNYGLTIGDAILITPIASALSIVTILLAIIFLKERITKTQGIGVATAVVGIVVTGL